jgi:GNAT acetyltransferase-like protein
LRDTPRFQERRRRGIKKAQAAGVVVRQTEDYDTFWPVLEGNLERVHGVRPVHSLAEIRHLQRLFPQHIKLFGSYLGGRMLAGVVVFENARLAHAQYISASEEGKQLGALDVLFSSLITEHYAAKDYFDFGISTERGGLHLNAGLIEQKEGFGARAVVHDCYELDILPSPPGQPCL